MFSPYFILLLDIIPCQYFYVCYIEKPYYA